MNFSALVDTINKNENKLGNRGWRITNQLRNDEGLIIETKFRLTEDQNRILIELANIKKISKSELIRTYIEWGLENEEC